MSVSGASPRKKDVALAFIMERIARSGRPPSLREIAKELKVSVARVQELLSELEDDDAIERTRGVHLSIKVRDVAGCRSALTQVLRNLGFAESAFPLTLEHLPMLPDPEHSPDP